MLTDTAILIWINSHHSEFWDNFMWAVSGRWTWIPLYLLMLIWLGLGVKEMTRPWLRFGLLLLLIAALVGLTDQCCHLLKTLIAQPRPTHCPDLEGVLHLVRGYTGGMYGHPSSHAANTMAIATFFIGANGLFAPYWGKSKMGKGIWMLIMALFVGINCYSRMYLGVHYPSNILFGLLIGALFGLLGYGALLRLFVALDRSDDSQIDGTDLR